MLRASWAGFYEIAMVLVGVQPIVVMAAKDILLNRKSQRNQRHKALNKIRAKAKYIKGIESRSCPVYVSCRVQYHTSFGMENSL